MSEYKLTVGLEIHAQLRTNTKMFCNSKNDPDEKVPNSNVCPICMGHPGTLPVINKQAVEHVLKVGTAVGGEIADYTEFDRKNYFYPDIPKGYQISQYKHPLVEGGELAGIKITRIHLEEDTARSTHDKSDDSLVDFNRAGVPLMELVTEPVIHSPAEAANFAKELQLLLRSLNAGEANMEKGEMRVEANVSVATTSALSSLNPFSSKQLGTKVEVKNLNSFRSVERAIAFEMERQIKVLESGEKVAHETRGWDEVKEVTFSQRMKEESHDYRYFPDPDLPKLFISEIPDFAPETLRQAMPELPWEKRERLTKLGITAEHAEIYVSDKLWGNYFDEVAALLGSADDIKLASNYITSELKTPIPAGELAEIVRMIQAGELSSRGAKEVIKIISAEGGQAKKIAEEKNLIQKNDPEALRKIAEKVINENPGITEVNFLIGKSMAESKGSANPQVLREILLELLS